MTTSADGREVAPIVGSIRFTRLGPTGPLATVVRIQDHGTGLLPWLLQDLDAGPPIELQPLTTAPTTEGQLSVEIRTTDDPDVVEVHGSWSPVPSRWLRSEVGDRVLAQVTRRYLDQTLGDGHLHAGAVATADGLVALVVGASGAGKSTLVSHLVAGGLELLTDEQVALRPAEERVAAFTRPIAVKPGGQAVLPEAASRWLDRTDDAAGLVPAAALGGQHRLAGRPVLVCLLDRRAPGAARNGAITAEDLPPAEALFALTAHSLDLVRDPPTVLNSLAWLASTVRVVRLSYEHAPQAAAWVRSVLDAPPRTRPSRWRVIEPPPKVARRNRPTAGVGQAGYDVTTVDLDDGAVLYRAADRSLVHLDRAAAATWDRLPLEEVPPGEAELAILRDLQRRGFVRAAMPLG